MLYFRLIFCLVFVAFFRLTGSAQDALIKGAFLPAHYYDKEGQRVEGLISHAFGRQFGDTPDNFIYYKAMTEPRSKS